MEAVSSIKPTRKFYIFDRDTLIDRKRPPALINPDFLISFLRIIDREESFQWAIASEDAIEWDADPVKHHIGPSVSKRPFYTQLASDGSSVKNLVFKFSGEQLPPWIEEDKSYIIKQAEIKKVAYHVATAQIIFDMLLNNKWENCHVIKSNGLQAGLVFNSSIVFVLKLGNTYLTIRAETFFKQRKLIEKGDNKLFCVLLALDQARLELDKTSADRLKTLGIEMISSPYEYETISAKDIIFVDDKKGNCDLVALAGFTMIQADTPPAHAEGKSETVNTYMEKLNQTIPEDILFKNFVAEASNLILKDTHSEIIVEKRNSALKQIAELFENNDLRALQTLPQLAPLFNYKEFRFFSKSIDPMCATPQLLALADAYIGKNQYQKELSDFLVLNLCQDWRRPEIQTKIAAITNIKPEDQITVTATHFRIAYMAQYQSEFFKNPFSKMREQILRDPAEFDNIKNIDITKENGRSKEVLTKLGVVAHR